MSGWGGGVLSLSNRADPELARLADRHYSRGKIGSPQFVPPGYPIVLRNKDASVGWVWLRCKPGLRYDKQEGYCCTLFRRESGPRASEIILEAERWAIELWGPGRGFTYVDPRKVKSRNPGYCFIAAGWRKTGTSKSGLWLYVKDPITGQGGDANGA